MGKKNKGANKLGRTLIKDRFGHQSKRSLNSESSMLHTTEVQDGYDWGRLNLQSVTEESNFDDFFRTAELAGTEFQAEKMNITFINPKSTIGLLTDKEKTDLKRKHFEKKDLLKIPRRPKWTKETTPEDLRLAENEAFLEWRRVLALLQEQDELVLTPYEKNLEFWRQLWRVVERSDIVVQIVDARNPLLFRSEDLEKYVKEVQPNKMNMILVNKADFLNDEQRSAWADYFQRAKIRIAFYSAKLAAEEDTQEGNTETQEESEMIQEQLKTSITELSRSLDKTEKQLDLIESKLKLRTTNYEFVNSPRILSRKELISFLKTIHSGPKYTENVTTIGLVGYPNVGKSSTINSLLMEKKTSVSVTPGKTKHFQTLFLEKDLMLCDCPGLVMPSFVLTKADMILCGILPIDQLRDHVPPVNLLCTQIPRHVLEDKYGIIIAKPIEGEDPDRPPHSEDLLLAYGFNRGFMTANGQPDQSRSSRYILKDYVNGKLLYCYAPPNSDQEKFHTFPAKLRKETAEEHLPDMQRRAMRINKNLTSKELDNNFFETNANTVYIKGKSNFPHIRPTGSSMNLNEVGSINSLNKMQISEKPWKNVKKEKREKLRKKFVHLDQH